MFKGVIAVHFDACCLYSKSCKLIGKTSLSRSDDDDSSSQIAKVKGKEVWFQEGYTIPIGNKDVVV